VKWESREVGSKNQNQEKPDYSLKSFVFTLKNPHNISARRFALKEEAKQWAINCNYLFGLCFIDIAVLGECNESDSSFTSLGTVYTNDTGLDNEIVFTGSKYFQVEEIEVFEITT
jgi:hypothetical protein